MTATTSRGVKCGNCGEYHPSALDVRSCYAQGRSTTKATPEHAQEALANWHDAPRSPQWRTNNAAESPLARGKAAPATDGQMKYIKDLLSKREVVDGVNYERALIVADVYAGKVLNKSTASALIDWLKEQPKKSSPNGYDVTASAAYPDVPAGHYAITSLTGNNDLDFFRVDRPKDGRYGGRTFVKRVIGGHPDVPVRGMDARRALQAILREGVEQAAQRYGREVGRCFRCNRHLTDETSRQLGIGPDCRNR